MSDKKHNIKKCYGNWILLENVIGWCTTTSYTKRLELKFIFSYESRVFVNYIAHNKLNSLTRNIASMFLDCQNLKGIFLLYKFLDKMTNNVANLILDLVKILDSPPIYDVNSSKRILNCPK